MIYFCIYQPSTKLIAEEKTFPDSEEAQAKLEWPLWPLEAQQRGSAAGWQAYRGDRPFEFPPEPAEGIEETAPDA